MDKIDDLKIGIIGEHLVCADVMLKGYDAFLSDQGLPYDIVIDINGVLLKIQVKTTRHHKSMPQRKEYTPTYIFNIKRCGKKGKKQYIDNEIDLFAMVSLDTKQIGYVLPSMVKDTFFIRLDSYKGSYYNEKQKEKYNQMFKLQQQGLSTKDISEMIKIDKSTISKVLSGKQTYKQQGRYFDDITFEKAINEIAKRRIIYDK